MDFKKIFSMLVASAFIFGMSANISAEKNFVIEQEYFASSSDKDKMLDDKLRKQVEKKRAEQLERKAKNMN